MTREEKAVNIRAGQRRAWQDGKRWGYPLKGDVDLRHQLAAAVELGEMTLKAASAEVGIAYMSMSLWMKQNGYKVRRGRNLPTERDLKALREYWARECTQRDVMEFTGRNYYTVHKWILKGYGKENNNA